MKKLYEKYLDEAIGKPEPKQAILKKLSDYLLRQYNIKGKGKIMNVKWKGGDVEFDIFVDNHGMYLRTVTYHFVISEGDIDEILYTGTM